MSFQAQPLQHHPQQEISSKYLYDLIHGKNTPEDVSKPEFQGLANYLKETNDPQRSTILDYINYNNPELPSERWNSYRDENAAALKKKFSGNSLRDVLQLGSPSVPGYQVAGGNQPKARPAPNPDWAYINNRERAAPAWLPANAPLEGRVDPQTIDVLKKKFGEAYTPNVSSQYHNFGVRPEPEGKMLGMVLNEQGLSPPTQEMIDASRANKTGVRSPFLESGEGTPPWSESNQSLEDNLGSKAWRSKGGTIIPPARPPEGSVPSRTGINTLDSIGNQQNQEQNASPGMLSRASSFASRSLPLLNLGLLSAAIYQNYKSGNQQYRGRS